MMSTAADAQTSKCALSLAPVEPNREQTAFTALADTYRERT
ncbi:MAG: hypothetical protein ABI604_19595 [Nitrospirota bacterium]